MADLPRIVIVGGGFGGLRAAKGLAGARAQVTVVDRSNHHLFQPLLYQVATATLSPADIAMPIRHILRRQANAEVILAEVTRIDVEGRQVQLADAAPLKFDYLVLAAGNSYNYFGHSRWEQLAKGLKSIEDATYIRGQILAAFEYAERSADESEQQEHMTFLIVGGGPTGVEMAGAIAELSRKVLEGDFRHIKPARARIVVIEAADSLLLGYPEKLRKRALRDLEDLGVKVLLNTMVTGVDEAGVDTSGGRLAGRNVIWAAGVRAAPVGNWLGAETDKGGRLPVNSDLSVPGLDGRVFAIGDCMALHGADGKPLPGVAQVAIQQGAYVGRILSSRLIGKPYDKPFAYHDLGSLATIGRSRAVADFGWIRLAGWPAWWIWLFVHILKLVGFRNRLSILLQWAWSYFTWESGARIITPAEWARMRPVPESDGRAS